MYDICFVLYIYHSQQLSAFFFFLVIITEHCTYIVIKVLIAALSLSCLVLASSELFITCIELRIIFFICVALPFSTVNLICHFMTPCHKTFLLCRKFSLSSLFNFLPSANVATSLSTLFPRLITPNNMGLHADPSGICQVKILHRENGTFVPTFCFLSFQPLLIYVKTFPFILWQFGFS